MSWSYRIIYHESDKGMPWYGLHEVYRDKRGRVYMWTEEPSLVGESEDSILVQLEMMRHDVLMHFAHPLYESNLVAANNRWDRRLRLAIREWWIIHVLAPWNSWRERDAR